MSCPHCFDKTTDDQKARYAEREKQIQLALQRGEAHIGMESNEAAELHRQEKIRRKEQDRLAVMKKHHR